MIKGFGRGAKYGPNHTSPFIEHFSRKDHITNEKGQRKIQTAIGEYDELLIMAKNRNYGGSFMSQELWLS